jgi:hypothetical protein
VQAALLGSRDRLAVFAELGRGQRIGGWATVSRARHPVALGEAGFAARNDRGRDRALERELPAKAYQREATRKASSGSLFVINDNVRRKIQDLIVRAPALSGFGGIRDDQHMAQCSAWITEALNAVSYAIPSPQNAYRVRLEGDKQQYVVGRLATAAETLRSLLLDIDAGLLGDLGNQVRAETFDNFLDHGQVYLDADQKMEAGVIAGVVFEDTIRRIYRDKIADDDKGKNLEGLINALARNGVITGQQSKQAKVAAHVRNQATHALWDEFNIDGVRDTIQVTRRFLADHLGG